LSTRSSWKVFPLSHIADLVYTFTFFDRGGVGDDLMPLPRRIADFFGFSALQHRGSQRDAIETDQDTMAADQIGVVTVSRLHTISPIGLHLLQY